MVHVQDKDAFVFDARLLQLKDLVAKMPAELVQRIVEKVVIVKIAGLGCGTEGGIEGGVVVSGERVIVEGGRGRVAGDGAGVVGVELLGQRCGGCWCCCC